MHSATIKGHLKMSAELDTLKELTGKFELIVAQLIVDIALCFPELETNLAQISAMPTETLIDYFCAQALPVAARIMLKDERLFYEGARPTMFLPGISFTAMWIDKGIGVTTQEQLWEYLSILVELVTTAGKVAPDKEYETETIEN